MIKRLIELRDGVDLTCLHYKDELKEDTLTSKDWRQLSDFCDLLTPLAYLSTRNQGSATKGSHGALWEWLTSVDMCLFYFEEKRNDLELCETSFFKACVNLGWKKLDQYYCLSDDVPAYRAAVALHPKYKTAWFKKH